MKNVYKSFALLCMGLAAVACVEEPFDDTVIDTTPGNEIVFTAKANVDDVKTKTEYGAVSDDGKTIAVHWKNGDKIQIASPNTSGTQNAEYRIGTVNGENNSNAETLTKTGDVGLQWSSEAKYNFYAMYPSPASTSTSIDALSVGEEGAIMVGYIPSVQKEISKVSTTIDGITYHEYKPDMNYAYMAANDTYVKGASDDDVSLAFSPIFTALQFDISIPNIGSITYDKNIWLKSVTVSSDSFQLSGTFNYNFTDKKCTLGNSQFDASKTVSIQFEDYFALAEKDVCTVTLFIMPINSWKQDAEDLHLIVEYLNAGKIYTKTATISVPISAGKKHRFENVLLPEFEEVSGGSWVESLNPDTPVSQLSIPIAGNVFANSEKYNTEDRYSQQQITYDALWRLGVRGFEFVNQTTGSDDTSDAGLANEKFVCSEKELSQTPTFDTAFKTLTNFFAQEENTKEFLILLCTYQASDDGYNPDRYVKELLTYFDYFIANSGGKFTQENFVKITANTTVKELRGNIAVIIRPGDDDRYETNSYTKNIALSSKRKDWTDHVTLIQDWGTAFDVWDRRYYEKQGEDLKVVAREATFESLYVVDKAGKRNQNTMRPFVEDYLYGQSSSSGSFSKQTGNSYNSFNDFGSGNVLKCRETFDYAHTITGLIESEGQAFVQEWARVAPIDEVLNSKGYYTGYNAGTVISRSPFLWVKWPESITEKKRAIDGLFKLSVSRNLDRSDIFINVLSGYYIKVASKDYGLIPFMESSDFTGIRGISSQGKGGDYKGLAADLNEYVYGILSGNQPLTKNNPIEADEFLDKGPWGLIVIDHIQNQGVSTDLVNLIMMNNFRM